MDNDMIVKCGICGSKILYQGKKFVVNEVLALQLKTEGAEQNGALWWHAGEVYPAKQDIDDCNAFLEEELVHKITEYGEMTIAYYTCGSGYVYIIAGDKKFKFDETKTIVDALGEALEYLLTL
jgi:hypothetical protein